MTRPLTIQEAARALRSGGVTSVELVDRAIEAADALDESLGVFISRFDDTARERAREADAELTSGRDRGPLHGIPIGVKDVVATREGPTTCQSLISNRTKSLTGDAVAIARLREDGAVLVGKTTTMEFACGMPDESKPFPVPRNPWDLDRWAGGSSSGTGSGLAVGMFLGGVATDTCGSGRAPAAYCGVTGLRQTYGLVPNLGSMPLAESMDTITPMARTAWDCASMLSVMAGHHAEDPTSASTGAFDYTRDIEEPIAGLRIGVDRAHTVDRDGMDPLLGARFDAALHALEDEGARIVELEIPMFDELIAAALVSFPAEALAHHLGDLQTDWNDYGRHTRAVLTAGAFVTGADLARAGQVRRAGRSMLLKMFEDVDVVCTPTAATGAPLLQPTSPAVSETGFRPLWSAVGFPALSVPIGLGADGTPLALQIASPPFTDALTLQVGHRLQLVTDWHLFVAPLSRATY